MYDFHVHSSFSGDCKYPMEKMVKGAIEKNLKMISFTDHIDYEYGESQLDFAFETLDYLKEVKRLKSKFKQNIEVLSGIELGIQPHLGSKIPDLIDLNAFDFVIMSLHIVEGKEIHEGNFYKGKTSLQAYQGYYNDLLWSLESFDDFDVVGHLNIVERYGKYLDKILDIEEYQDVLINVLKKIISMEKGIEVNTSGIRYGMDSFLPGIEILKLYKSLGGEIITIGSDAHRPDDIGFGYRDVISLLREVGFKHICIFRNRKKQFIRIE